MPQALDKLTIKGFKSIKSLEDFELKNLNVLIGANGAGKSNFVELFRVLRAMFNENFANYIQKHGGADGFMFNGPKVTHAIAAEFVFGDNAYCFELEPSTTDDFIITTESERYLSNCHKIGSGNRESRLKAFKNERSAWYPGSPGMGYYVYEALANWTVYHFHDTSMLAPIRRTCSVRDNEYLWHDAGNLAAFLMMLNDQHQDTYEQIRDTVRLVTPFFNDFKFRPKTSNGDESIQLEWTQKNSNDHLFHVSQFSDGTLRFIALATALLQPNPPSTIIIDEPELGLHPFAIDILAELIEAASKHTQVIISTQSPALVDCFAAENIIVVNRKDGASCFERLDEKNLSSWLEDYSLGELWRKNVIDGGPTHE